MGRLYIRSDNGESKEVTTTGEELVRELQDWLEVEPVVLVSADGREIESAEVSTESLLYVVSTQWSENGWNPARLLRLEVPAMQEPQEPSAKEEGSVWADYRAAVQRSLNSARAYGQVAGRRTRSQLEAVRIWHRCVGGKAQAASETAASVVEQLRSARETAQAFRGRLPAASHSERLPPEFLRVARLEGTPISTWAAWLKMWGADLEAQEQRLQAAAAELKRLREALLDVEGWLKASDAPMLSAGRAARNALDEAIFAVETAPCDARLAQLWRGTVTPSISQTVALRESQLQKVGGPLAALATAHASCSATATSLDGLWLLVQQAATQCAYAEAHLPKLGEEPHTVETAHRERFEEKLMGYLQTVNDQLAARVQTENARRAEHLGPGESPESVRVRLSEVPPALKALFVEKKPEPDHAVLRLRDENAQLRARIVELEEFAQATFRREQMRSPPASPSMAQSDTSHQGEGAHRGRSISHSALAAPPSSSDSLPSSNALTLLADELVREDGGDPQRLEAVAVRLLLEQGHPQGPAAAQHVIARKANRDLERVEVASLVGRLRELTRMHSSQTDFDASVKYHLRSILQEWVPAAEVTALAVLDRLEVGRLALFVRTDRGHRAVQAAGVSAQYRLDSSLLDSQLQRAPIIIGRVVTVDPLDSEPEVSLVILEIFRALMSSSTSSPHWWIPPSE